MLWGKLSITYHYHVTKVSKAESGYAIDYFIEVKKWQILSQQLKELM